MVEYQVGSRVQHEGDRNAIVLTSGGADSIPVLYYVAKVIHPQRVLALHVDYGQTMMEMERLGVTKNVEHLRRLRFNVDLKTIDIRWLGELSTSKLVSKEPLPETDPSKLQDPDSAAERILWWWDVVRNLELVTIGLAHAESFDLRHYLQSGKKERAPSDVYIGIRRETPVPMRDNTPEFLEEMNRVANISTHFGGYQVKAPFIDLDKPALLRLGEALGVQWQWTFSCYTNTDIWEVHPKTGERILAHCGRCSNDKRRAIAFKDANIYDPSLYLRPPLGDVEYEDIGGVYIQKLLV